MKIYNNNPGNIFTNAAMITAAIAKIPVEEVFLSEEEQKGKEYKLKCLTGKFPCLETNDGTLFESAAIARYFARLNVDSKLAGVGNHEQALVDQWIDFINNNVYPHVFTVARATFGWVKTDAEAYNHSLKELKEHIKTLNVHLQGKDYLVGNHLTVADIVAISALILPYQIVLDAGFRKAMPNTTKWAENLIKLPEFVQRYGLVKFAQKTVKPTLEEKKKEEAPKPQAAAKKNDDDEDGEGEKKPKDKDPRDEPSAFNLYDFKTFFVNSKDRRGEGMTEFFKQYVPADYCIYFLHYEKYDGEGIELYKTQNLFNGFLQRIDHFRKHCLAMHAILGVEGNYEIQGVWMFRGKGIPQEMKDHPQFEYHKIRELDIEKAEDKQLLVDFWSAKAGDTVNGLPVVECKLHK